MLASDKNYCEGFTVISKYLKRALNDLVKAGLIEKEVHYRENGGNTSNRFILRK
jgi:hypothetical protein